MLTWKRNQYKPIRTPRLLTAFFTVLIITFFLINCGKPRVPSADPTSGPAVSTSSSDEESSVAFPLPEIEARIEPSSIQSGESALLTWETRNATRVTIGPAVGNVDISGRIRVFPEQTTEYVVEAEGKGGTVNKTIVLDVTSSLTGAGILEEDLARATIEEQFAAKVKPVFFGFDSAQLSPEAMKILDGNLQWLSLPQNQAIHFVIEGHADERGSEEYNLALGDARAEAAAEYLRKGGIDHSRIATISLGEERPFDSGKTEAAYAQNRRAQFVLLKTQ